MADFRTRNKSHAFKIGAGDQAPTLADDAILMEDASWSANIEVLETNEHTGSLDPEAPIVGGGGSQFSSGILLKGSGAAETPPEAGPILRSGSLDETITSAAITGVAQGGGASSITLAAGASATDDFYKGMPIRVTDSTGDGQIVIVAEYDGTTKVASVLPPWDVAPVNGSDYEILKNVRYAPASTGLEVGTLYEWQHNSAAGGNSLLRKITDAAANLSFEITVRGIARMAVNLSGILPGNPANVAHPGAAVIDATRPPVFMAADAYLGGAAVKFNRVSIDLGNTVQQADDPAATFGLDVAGVVTRNVTGSINPQLSLLSVRNIFADFMAGTEKSLLLHWGSATGNRIAMLQPRIRYTGATPIDVNGFAAEEVPYKAVGADDGFWLTFY